ncbi:MAG TPA: hypothetical protein PLV45_07780 [bacterium]|nr:hypothetical protein [bacterium]
MKTAVPGKYTARLLDLSVLTWITLIQSRSLSIWFDWETVRFFVLDRPNQFRWIEPLTQSWVDLTDYGIIVASMTLRPLMTWSFQIESLLFGAFAPGYHILNLAGHLACVWLLMTFLRKVGVSLPVSALAGLLFGIHPLTTQPMWILGDRAEIAVLLGGLIALVHYERRPGIACLGMLLALYSKETAVTLPGWLLIYDLLFVDTAVPFRRTLRFRIRRLIWPVLLTAGYLIHRTLVFGGVKGYRHIDHFRIDHVLDVLIQNVSWIFTIATDTRWILVPVAGMILLAFGLKRLRIARFGIIWFCIFMLPLMNLCNKWYLYTPVAAATVLFSGLVDPMFRDRRFRGITAMGGLLIALVFSVLSSAELNHQHRNAAISLPLARQIRQEAGGLPNGSKILVVLTPPYRAAGLKGHFFDPDRNLLKSHKPPLESIVWDLNSVRYIGTRPVWNRSIEAAVRLLYDDISIGVELTDIYHLDTHAKEHVVIQYNPDSGEIFRQAP